MKEITAVKVDSLHRGVALIFTTKEGIETFKLPQNQARWLMKLIFIKLGTKRAGGRTAGS